jgi:hypothetical protein
MNRDDIEYLAEVDMNEFFEQLFPYGILGDDVLMEIGPRLKWRHPILRMFLRSLITLLPQTWQPSTSLSLATEKSWVEHGSKNPFTEEDVRAIAPHMGACLYATFSATYYRVVTADGRAVEGSSGRGLSCFVNKLIAKSIGNWPKDRNPYFFLGDYEDSDTYDLQEIYLMIFRRLQALGADWGFCTPDASEVASRGNASRSGKEMTQEEKDLRKEIDALCAYIDRMNAASPRIPWSGPDPSPVEAYRCVFGRAPQ